MASVVYAVGSEYLVNDIMTSGNQRNSCVTKLVGGGYVATWATDVGDGSGWGIYQQQYAADGAKVGTQTAVNTYTTSDQNYPVATSMPDGGWVVAWVSVGQDRAPQDTTGTGVYMQRFGADGGRIAGETLVNSTTLGNQDQVAIATLRDDATGQFNGILVTWSSADGQDRGVFQRKFTYDNGQNKWVGSAETGINATKVKSQIDSSVADLPGGGWVVTWQSEDTIAGGGVETNIYQRIYDSNGLSGGPDILVNQNATAGNQSDPGVTALANGDYIVTWTSDTGDGSGTGVFARLYSANGFAKSDVFRVNTAALGNQFAAKVTALTGGGFVVTWTGNDANVYGIYQQVFDKDGVFVGEETRVNTFEANEQRASSVVVLDDGAWVVSWTSQNQVSATSGYDIYQQRFRITDNNHFVGIGLPDSLTGTAAADTLDGGGGADTLKGGLGNDTYFVDHPGDSLYEGGNQGTDTVVTTINWNLDNDFENLRAATGVTSGLTLRGNSLANVVIGGGGSDVLMGMDANDRLAGAAGNDFLDGGTGADTMAGGIGDDFYRVDNPGDVVVEDSAVGGIDTVSTTVKYMLAANVENLRADASAMNGLVLTGNAEANSVTGSAYGDTIKGMAGSDRIVAGSGSDTIDGGTGNDVLMGGAGNDRIYGGLGRDNLYGGAGRDVFVFNTRPKTAEKDKISDYKKKDDSIYLDDKYFKGIGKGSITKPKKMLKDAFYMGSKAHDKDDRIIYDNKKGILYYDPDGIGSKKLIVIATMSKKLKMDYGEFFVI